ncbi:hypothetical protein AXF42_Ash000693 [Apostasia shenzhenica]|uniref:Uncharacterized protein n=1 Tax=Apostasia shenzhenica TaxID=1088818 RepID=A0A2I0AH45_9ASPA|nr:hypothetical protein AXF42_Ash000693 [Apostasia shenzhenica]
MSAQAWPSAFSGIFFSGDPPLRRQQLHGGRLSQPTPVPYRRLPPLRVLDESTETDTEPDVMNSRLESDKLVDDMDFGEVCNEFECISSPLVEMTARQLARDILEMHEGNRSLGYFSVSVKYKDPVRAFTGREKYKRPLWVNSALENPTVTVQGMQMLSTSELIIKWTLKGRPKNTLLAILGGDLILQVNSKFLLNQISGQVIEHEELWDLSSSSVIAQSFFWVSRMLFSTVEAGKDTVEAFKRMAAGVSSDKENTDIYPDMSGDPTKFFQRDDGFQRDAYQVALFLAITYFVVQFLKSTL